MSVSVGFTIGFYSNFLSNIWLLSKSSPNKKGFFLIPSTTYFSEVSALGTFPTSFIFDYSGYRSFIVTVTPVCPLIFCSRTLILFSFCIIIYLSLYLLYYSSFNFFWTFSTSNLACFTSSSFFLKASYSYRLYSSSFLACDLTFLTSASSWYILLFESAGDSW